MMAATAIKTVKPGERRLDHRHLSNELKITFLGGDYTAINWSRSGFLVIDRIPHVPVGTMIDGFLKVPGCDGRYRFSAELARRDGRTFEIAFRFIDPSPAIVGALARHAEG